MILFDRDSCCLHFCLNQIFVKVNSDIEKKMKSVSVVKVYTATERNIAVDWENHRVDNSCLKFHYLGSFCFCTSAFILLL